MEYDITFTLKVNQELEREKGLVSAILTKCILVEQEMLFLN